MKIFRFLAVILIASALGSCQKVIHINLNASAPRYVIEGNIVPFPAQSFVSITRSVNFDQDNKFPTVSGALVIVTDQTMNLSDTFTEMAPGRYTPTRLASTPGHTYAMYVKVDSQVFTATSTMPQLVHFDSLYDKKSAFGKQYQLVPVYTDPATKGNNYQFVVYINGQPSDGVYVANDKLINGQKMELALSSRGPVNSKIQMGDFVQVYMNCIDSAVYEYFFTLQQTKNQNSATPSNPLTNIKGGALGYFSAFTQENRVILSVE